MIPKLGKKSEDVKETHIDYNSDMHSMLLGVGEQEKESERFSFWGVQSRTEVISGIQLVGYLLCTVQVVVFLINGDQNYIDNKDGIILGVYLGTVTIGFVSSVFLYCGVQMKNPALLSIWLNTTKIIILVWTAGLIVFPRRLPLILLQTKGGDRDGDEFEEDVIIFNGMLWSLYIGFHIFCCWFIFAQREEMVYTASLDEEMGGKAKEVEALGCQKA